MRFCKFCTMPINNLEYATTITHQNIVTKEVETIEHYHRWCSKLQDMANAIRGLKKK